MRLVDCLFGNDRPRSGPGDARRKIRCATCRRHGRSCRHGRGIDPAVDHPDHLQRVCPGFGDRTVSGRAVCGRPDGDRIRRRHPGPCTSATPSRTRCRCFLHRPREGGGDPRLLASAVAGWRRSCRNTGWFPDADRGGRSQRRACLRHCNLQEDVQRPSPDPVDLRSGRDNLGSDHHRDRRKHAGQIAVPLRS